MIEWITQIDFAILDWIQAVLRSAFMDTLMPLITSLSNGGWFWIACAVVLICFKRTRKVGIAAACAMLFMHMLGNELLKPLVARVRPCDINTAVDLLVKKPSSYSFPSGHTATAFAFSAALFARHKKFGTAALVLSALVGFSRMYLYVHYPSDVLGGALCGILCAWLAWLTVNAVDRAIQNRKGNKLKLTAKEGFSEDCKLIRTEVFVDEQGFREEFDTVDDKALHVVLYDKDIPVATGRTFREADAPHSWHFGRIAVRKAYRGKGVGKQVMQYLETAAKAQGATRFCLSAQMRAKAFYEALGYTAVGEAYLEEDYPHIYMEKSVE